jgi:hypothetical protein
MRLNADNSFMLRVYLFIMQHVNNILIVCFQKKKKLRKSVPESRETQFWAFVWVQHLYDKSGLGIFCEACGDEFLRNFVPEASTDCTDYK